jgi:hypothetical protein
MPAIFPAYLIRLHSLMLEKCTEDCTLWSSSLYNFLHPLISSLTSKY